MDGYWKLELVARYFVKFQCISFTNMHCSLGVERQHWLGRLQERFALEHQRLCRLRNFWIDGLVSRVSSVNVKLHYLIFCMLSAIFIHLTVCILIQKHLMLIYFAEFKPQADQNALSVNSFMMPRLNWLLATVIQPRVHCK